MVVVFEKADENVNFEKFSQQTHPKENKLVQPSGSCCTTQ
jgi:hypothetical protein